MKARENHKFHLIYWDVIRELREEKIDQYVKLVKQQRLKKTHLAFLKLQQIVKKMWKEIEHWIEEEQIKRFRAMRSRQIQEKFRNFCKLFGPTEDIRIQK